MEIFAGMAFGILGSFHCLGMCGPIALAIPHRSTNKITLILDSIIYNLGRVFTYTLLGILFGYLGKSLSLAGLQEKISIFAGILLLLILFIPKKYKTASFFGKYSNLASGKLKGYFRVFLTTKTLPALFMLGILNGLLPCGLVYLAVVVAIASGDIIQSASYMAGFGFGTIPMMASIYYAKNLITINFRQKLSKSIPYFVAIVAVIMIMRGMALGIPYISPELPKTIEKKANCCHNED